MLDKLLGKFVAIHQKDNFRKVGTFESQDDCFIYLRFTNGKIQGISKDEIKLIEETKERQ